MQKRYHGVPWEGIVDVREGERLSETLLDAVSDMFKFNTRLRMDPLKFERFVAYAEKGYERAKRLRIRKKVARSFRYLQKAGFVAEERGSFRLTPKGWMRYAWNYSRAMKNLKRKKSQKKIFIVIFDVPEHLRRFRDSLRRTLYNLGFEQLQKSVFIGYNRDRFAFVSRVVAQTELFDRVKLIIGERV